MAIYRITDLVDITNAAEFDFSVGVTTLYTGADFLLQVKSKHGHMLYEAYADVKAEARREFEDTYRLWKNRNEYDYLRIYEAMRAEYDALENYDRKEEGETETARHKGSRTAQSVNMTSTPNTTSTTDEKLNAYDGGEVDSAKTTTTNTGTTTTSGAADANYTETRDISDTVYDKDIEIYRGRRTHGNIGVTTTQALISEELTLRFSDFIAQMIDKFITTYTFYVSGV